MANTGKHIAPRHSAVRVTGRASVPAAVLGAEAGTSIDTPLSPRVEMLRKLVASGQYQVSARYLAYKIFRAAGIQPA